MQRALTKRERVILLITAGVIVLSLATNLLIVPIAERNESLNKEIKVTQTRLRKYIQLLSGKDYLKKRNEEFVLGAVDTSAGQDTLVNILAELETIAKQENIRIIDIRPQSPRSLDLYKEMIIDLKAEGSLEGYMKFIYDIEHSLLLLRIRKLQLEAKPASQYLEAAFSIVKLSSGE